MKSNRVIEAAVRAAQDFLWQNAPPMHYLTDEVTVGRLRDLIRSPTVQAALLQSSDAFLTFVRALSTPSLIRAGVPAGGSIAGPPKAPVLS